jgi:hypothetical protein
MEQSQLEQSELEQSRLAQSQPNQPASEKKDLLRIAAMLFQTGQVDTMRDALRRRAKGKKPAVDIIAEDIIGLLPLKDEQEDFVEN